MDSKTFQQDDEENVSRKQASAVAAHADARGAHAVPVQQQHVPILRQRCARTAEAPHEVVVEHHVVLKHHSALQLELFAGDRGLRAGAGLGEGRAVVDLEAPHRRGAVHLVAHAIRPHPSAEHAAERARGQRETGALTRNSPSSRLGSPAPAASGRARKRHTALT